MVYISWLLADPEDTVFRGCIIGLSCEKTINSVGKTVMGGARAWAAVPTAFSRKSPPGVKGTGSDSEVYLAHFKTIWLCYWWGSVLKIADYRKRYSLKENTPSIIWRMRMKTYLQTIYFFIVITEYVKIFCLFYRGQVEQALGWRFKEKRFLL